MSNTGKDNFTLERINQLIAVLGQNTPQARQQVDAANYDWNQPHYFDGQQTQMLSEFAIQTAIAISKKLGQLLQGQFQSKPISTQQYYAAKFIQQACENTENNYYLVLNDQNNKACGLIIIPSVTATQWLTQLLGDSEKKEDSKSKLSQLESSLLTDIAQNLAKTTICSNQKLNLKTLEQPISEDFTLDLNNCEELCQIIFETRQKDSEQSIQIHLVLPCSRMLAVLGDTADKGASTPQQNKEAMLEHINEIPVSSTAKFACAELTFEQILTLQSGDVLLLNKKIGDPLELIIHGQSRYRAQPAKYEGKLAVIVTEAIQE